MRTKVDIALVREGKLNIQGWAFGKDPETEVKYRVVDGKGEEISGVTCESVRRDSVVEAFFPNYEKEKGRAIERELGFDINVPYAFGTGSRCTLEISVDGRKRRIRFNDKVIERFNSRAHKKREKLLALFQWETVEVCWEVLREKGLSVLLHKAIHKLKGIEEDYDYNEWYKEVKPSDEELERQRGEDFVRRPKFSIVIPVYRTPEKFLRRLLESIRMQTYTEFEVLLADASSYEGLIWEKSLGLEPRKVLEEYQKKDERFHYQILKENLGIAENTNEAIRMCAGDTDYVVLCDHDDELSLDALYECAKVVNENPDAKIIYSDEDKIDFESAYMFEPHFKTDYNPDLLRTVNYITHLFVVERKLLESIADTDERGLPVYERSEYDGAQDYDLILRCCEEAEKSEEWIVNSGQVADSERFLVGSGQVVDEGERSVDEEEISENVARLVGAEQSLAARGEGLSERDQRLLSEGRFTSKSIIHIPKALYHWRSHQLSTAANPEAKIYAFQAGERAVYEHCKRVGLPVKSVSKGITYGFYHVEYEIEKTREGVEPLISVIIPNKDHSKDLDLAIRSLLKGSYQNLEFIVVENNSTSDETFQYYREIEAEYPDLFSDEEERLLRYQHKYGERKAFENSYNLTREPISIENEGDVFEGRLAHPIVKVVKWEKEFNYSAINNFGVEFAHGEYILLLNNDIELLEENSLREMLSYVQRKDVGICGARLLYPDSVIQHAGVVMGFGGIAGASFIGIHDGENTYMHRAKCVQDYSCVTAACLLTKKSVFYQVGGLTEELKVAFNDVDYCMKVRAKGLKVVYNPYAKFHHYESKSRGLEDTPEKVERFNREIVELGKRWPEILKNGDPYYSPNLTLMKSNYVLRDLNKEKIGEPFSLPILKGIVW